VPEEAVRIVATAVEGAPLRVVTTSTGAAGRPLVRTTPVADRTDALAVVVRALADPDVDTVSMAQPVRAAASDDTLRPRQWALDTLRAETVWRRADGSATRTTRRAVVAVLDTGVDASHPDLRGSVLRGVDVLGRGRATTDPNGHGTHVAGIVAAVAGNRRGVAGLAPRAAVLPVRVLDATGAGGSDDVARGVVAAADRRPHVINLSLSASGDDPALARAVAYAQRKGVLVVAAAGNEGCGLLFRPTQYPAANRGVVGVGSVDRDLRGSRFSSCGSWVDVSAPGGDVWSTVPSSNRLGCTGPTGYCSLSGTSMASPHVAAASALAMSRRGWSASTVAARLERTARDLGTRGRDTTYGAGLLDVRALVG
jgi:cell wall-associated protease